MRDFGRRFRIAMDKFIVDILAPGMIGFAPMLLPLQDPVPMDYHQTEEAYRRQFAGIDIPRQRIARSVVWRPTWTPAVEDQN